MIIESVILEYLKRNLDVPVYTEFPANPPQSFVTIQKIDGGRKDYINASTISIECYGESKYQAALLQDSVKNFMYEIDVEPSISGSKLGGESDNTDTLNKRYRYEAIFNLYY